MKRRSDTTSNNAMFLLRVVSFLFSILIQNLGYIVADSVYHLTTDGPNSLSEGRRLYEQKNYNEAALYYWRAVLFQANNPDEYTVEEAYQGFLGCYTIRDRTVDGFLFIAKEVMGRKQKDMALQYIDQALA